MQGGDVGGSRGIAGEALEEARLRGLQFRGTVPPALDDRARIGQVPSVSVLQRAAGTKPFVAGPAKQGRRQQQQQRRHLSKLAVAAVEEPDTLAADDLEDNKEDMYRRFEQLLDDFTVSHRTGDKVVGTVFKVDQKGAYVDVGGKSTAYCPTAELSMASISRPTEVVGPDAVREFLVLREENNGELMLSLKRLQLQVAWQRLRQCMEEDVSVQGAVVGVNRGGLLVEAEGIRGFCPGSQIGFRVGTFEELMGKEMQFKITEVDEEKMRLMLSSKRAAAEEKAAAFKVGDVVEGSVISVKPYGAFVDIGGGVSGLLHISQISHDRIANVDKVLSEGDRIKVMVLSQERDKGRVSLCTKKLEPMPGDMLRDPALVYDKAEEMAALFRERVAAAEAAARAEDPSFAAAVEEAVGAQ
eukprot:scaffold14.g1165.t1